jgi:hypothetical protein
MKPTLILAFLSLTAAPAAAFSPKPLIKTRTKQRTSSLAAFPYKIGAKAEGLLINNRFTVDSLKQILPSDVPMTEIALLRFALAFPDEKEAESALLKAIQWRRTTGKHIVDAARDAVAKATANGGWDNAVVRDSAPHASLINEYITPKAVITASTEDGDLVYVIRASQIDDKAMMDVCTVEQVCDFFMYAKEVHNLVANERSVKSGRMCSVLFANDIR